VRELSVANKNQKPDSPRSAPRLLLADSGHTGSREAMIMGGRKGDDHEGSRWGGSGKATVVASGRGQVRIKKSSSRKLCDLPDLDLRTPSGRLLPF
jgi:hypothetical protein